MSLPRIKLQSANADVINITHRVRIRASQQQPQQQLRRVDWLTMTTSIFQMKNSGRRDALVAAEKHGCLFLVFL
jgi:hypothetical protein